MNCAHGVRDSLMLQKFDMDRSREVVNVQPFAILDYLTSANLCERPALV